jgi:outer membrane protein OmpA-like peptidoglycan-associated protein
MDEHPDRILVIEGHTDIRADEEYNLDLSIKRASCGAQVSYFKRNS